MDTYRRPSGESSGSPRDTPQHVSSPSTVMAQPDWSPAVTATYSPGGGVAWPTELSPQQEMAPSSRRAQAWSVPVAMEVKVSSPTEASDRWSSSR